MAHSSPIDVILSRRSIRKYQVKPIPYDIMNRILEAGRQAPSAGNRQPWYNIVVTDKRNREDGANEVEIYAYSSEFLGNRIVLREKIGVELIP